MIRRTSHKRFKVTEALYEASFTGSEGINNSKSPISRDNLHDIINFDIDYDGGLKLRKPLLIANKYSLFNGIITMGYIFDSDVKLVITDNIDVGINPFELLGEGNVDILYTFKYTLSDGTIIKNGDKTILSYVNANNATFVNTPTSTIISGCTVNYTAANMAGYLENLSGTIEVSDALPRYFRLTKTADSYELEMYSPPVNVLNETDTLLINPDLTLDNTYAYRDGYDSGSFRVDGILAYAPSEKTELGIIPYTENSSVYSIKQLTETDFTVCTRILNSITKDNNLKQIYLKAFVNINNTSIQNYLCIWERTINGIDYIEVPSFVNSGELISVRRLGTNIVGETEIYESVRCKILKINDENDLISERWDCLQVPAEDISKGYTYRFTVYNLVDELVTDNPFTAVSITSNSVVTSVNDLPINFENEYLHTATNTTSKFTFRSDVDVANLTATVYSIDVNGATVSQTPTVVEVSGGEFSIDYTLEYTNINDVELLKLPVPVSIQILSNDRVLGEFKYLSQLTPDSSIPILNLIDTDYIVDSPVNYIAANDEVYLDIPTEAFPIYRHTNSSEDIFNYFKDRNTVIVHALTGTRLDIKLGKILREIPELNIPADTTYVLPDNIVLTIYGNYEATPIKLLDFDSSKGPFRILAGSDYVQVAGREGAWNASGLSFIRIETDLNQNPLKMYEYLFATANTSSTDNNLHYFIKELDLNYDNEQLYNASLDIFTPENVMPIVYTNTSNIISPILDYYNLAQYVLGQKSYSFNISNETTYLYNDLGNSVMSNKLYFRKALHGYQDLNFKNLLTVSDVDSFTTPIFNSIDLNTTSDNIVTALVPWRDYLIAFTEQACYLLTSTEGTYVTKTINTFIGLTIKDSETCKSILNGIIFKSKNKIYLLQPSMYSSNDAILNISELSVPIKGYLEERSDNNNFAFTTEEAYYLFLPGDLDTICLKYEYTRRIWTKYLYPTVFIGYDVLSVDNIRIYSASGNEYYFEKELSDILDIPEELTDVILYGDYMTELPSVNVEDYNVEETDILIDGFKPIYYLLDSGQKTDNLSYTKQFVESKLLIATLNNSAVFPFDMYIDIDGLEYPIHINVVSDAPFWKTSVDQGLTLNSDAPFLKSNGFNIVRQMFTRYSGKGKSIRHILKGESVYAFKIYVVYYRYKTPLVKK